ncbi:hypothetical protein HQ45_04350 [Porphyromonas crevioricanis]|uniref:Uncharacterized protein predicted to be involved in DNA repair (RAMP superfamily) n=2 Tax=Porphyromonas crevioricanis TaxID=393921 RepID=A0A0A2FP41_9PORP|nr:CRISPR-associated endoribonuclease Cas6 [Porphyromonas crevioricanis]KGN90054.1 hypothetical protein HQ45_04350 [Porphyromonas crevioricanis]KGN94234.1 hypothetical protein HQ38_06835 [Porphyromonas crevioricanis]SJZ69309.1 CRISPR-associated endoribonuclease Cas6 [Porphyromonas crevioricanis]SQH72260.1 Uncharacterized protein predicted to be involved in DNA repair (RAMP superfamily) [Porphyromonas crevioricanis]GAD05083.1 CRISPR-associated protein, TM1814 family [Porphyromonas crevioricanis
MRLYIKVSASNRPIDFNYQSLLTGCVHKWLGRENSEHGQVSLYSFSWFQNVETTKEGIKLLDGSFFTLNFYDSEPARRVVKSILEQPEMFAGTRVVDIRLQPTPDFSRKERFFLASPVLIKRHNEVKETHYTYQDKEADLFMTETLKTKARMAGLEAEDVKVYFDRDYPNPRVKLISYKGIKNKANLCPVVVEGSPEMVAFAWNVGIGNSTGIGFGALK